MGDVAPPSHVPAPPSAHDDGHRDARYDAHRDGLRDALAAASAPARVASHRAARPGPLTWLPYLAVLGGVTTGIAVAWQGSGRAGPGAALVGGSLLAAGLARLILPDRCAGLLASRRKALDVMAFAVLGAAVLGVVLSLP